MTRVVALAAVLALACQGKGRDAQDGSGRVASGSAQDSAPIDAAPPADAVVAVEDGPRVEEPEPPDPSKLIADLGAIPAWQSVIDRAQLLARRGQHGVVYGVIGPPILMHAPAPATAPDAGAPVDAGMIASPYVWLVDDTEGNGALGIRVALGNREAKQGDRVALGGAWYLDDARHWYWKVDSLQALPPGPASELKDPKPAEPSHAIANGNLIPGARTISVARDNDAVYFQIVGPPPATEGDGWLVADELGDAPVALLSLPGERPSYGGQDMRSADEKWQLKKAQTYTLRIGKIRKRDPNKPALINARTAPVRVN
ncbi:MAG TPA: hypothetical protein VFQ53_26955 [Kofleriaceae bacterium]|nr:hypothetical protein [Kofleriaceae bacterium]